VPSASEGGGDGGEGGEDEGEERRRRESTTASILNACFQPTHVSQRRDSEGDLNYVMNEVRTVTRMQDQVILCMHHQVISCALCIVFT
jgi:hypothetical protein